MADIIHLLPDAVANQIAAGEVIQRPASAVKEVLENAVDAGSSRIQLIIRDAGKTLIQVIDDGGGMSETDSRLSFERHATSKIRKAEDLFSLHTMGFRGEALASIAAIAQVDLKSRLRGSEIGTKVVIEASVCKSQDPVATPEGTSLAIKNLFYNVPARRNFLKSNPVETRHIIEEFTRVAMSNPQIHFSFHHNDLQVFDLREGNFRQRIASICGNNYNERLVPVEEDTTIVKLEGFIGKPEFAKKNRGEQYFFVNNRFIKDSYLHHAVNAAFDSLIPKDAYASYWLKIYIDPAKIDVNIHPTKTEIKFEDEKSVYAILRAAVKRALGKFSIAPSLDFDQERAFDVPLDKLNAIPIQPVIKVNPNYNPFKPETSFNPNIGRDNSWSRMESQRTDQWLKLHQEPIQQTVYNEEVTEPVKELQREMEELPDDRFVLTGSRILNISFKNGILLIDLPGAHERILYERYLHALQTKAVITQQQLFPPRLQLSHDDALLVTELNDELRKLGFDLTDFGNNTIVIHGIPSGLDSGKETTVLQELLEQFRNNRNRLELSADDNLARSMARSMSVKDLRNYQYKELRKIALDLLQCENSNYGVNGKTILVHLNSNDLLNFFQS